METLANYWHKNDHDRDRIELFLEEAGNLWESGQVYPRVPYEIAEYYFEDEPLCSDESGEIIVVLFA